MTHQHRKRKGVREVFQAERLRAAAGGAVLPRTMSEPGDTDAYGLSSPGWVLKRRMNHSPQAAAMSSIGRLIVVSPGPHQENPRSSPKPTTDSSLGTLTPIRNSPSSTPMVCWTEPRTTAVGCW